MPLPSKIRQIANTVGAMNDRTRHHIPINMAWVFSCRIIFWSIFLLVWNTNFFMFLFFYQVISKENLASCQISITDFNWSFLFIF